MRTCSVIKHLIKLHAIQKLKAILPVVQILEILEILVKNGKSLHSILAEPIVNKLQNLNKQHCTKLLHHIFRNCVWLWANTCCLDNGNFTFVQDIIIIFSTVKAVRRLFISRIDKKDKENKPLLKCIFHLPIHFLCNKSTFHNNIYINSLMIWNTLYYFLQQKKTH